MLHN
ncbi:hypothetical protein YPPY56_2889, partial [Yersinia pestis PY-56]|jgi:hypothetical protein